MEKNAQGGAAAPYEIKLSIRWLAEFMLRGGSIDARFSGLSRALEGGRIHRMLQRQGGAGYAAEVALNLAVERGEFCYQLSGRADGVITGADGALTVDEIKTTAADLDALSEESHPAHWAQGRLYAHILCVQRGLAACAVRLTYYNVDTDQIRRFEKPHTAAELADFAEGLLAGYQRWARLTVEWKEKRGASLRALEFPFGEYRDGQRQMAIGCYNTYRDGGRLFCCAPTGIGKTISALFPAMKAIGEGFGERVFYLTAKTIARTAAEDAVARLRAAHAPAPLHFHSLTLTAKDKICFLDERSCLPETCPYANGYYDRVNDAVYDLLQGEGDFSRGAVEAAAEKYRLCPYELSLDLSLWCDCIICDYNYLFDPVVHLQRFFETGGKAGEHLFLIDEAHNLVDRSREMYSARLRKADFFAFKKELPKQHKRLHKALSGLNSTFIALRKQCEEENARALALQDLPGELAKNVQKFCAAAEAFLEDHRGSAWENDLLALYFEALFFTRIAEEYDHTYITLVYRYGNEITAKLFCLDPSARLDERMALGRASVLFSATLQPLPYYRQTLGGEGKLLDLPSPFDHENLGLFVADGVSTKYAQREGSLPAVAGLLAAMAGGKAGNYIAYFPSYSYLRQVHEVFAAEYPEIDTLVQQSGMDEAAREEFLARFAAGPEQTLLGFCVLGGIFAEGVDLPGERLIGTAVVGVGLPQIGPEPDAIRAYYDELNDRGFEFAYQFPGMNKVLQAAGRVIRTPEDRGVVVLIDSRFTSGRYQALFPGHWAHWRQATLADLPEKLEHFWNGG